MSLTSDPKFKNYMHIWEIKVNEKGTKVSGRASTGRKATNFDKHPNGDYVNSSWLIDFSNATEAKKLKTGDNIIVTKFSITSGECYAEGKYSPTKVTIWEWEYNDSARSSKSSDKKVEKKKEVVSEVDDDDEPF